MHTNSKLLFEKYARGYFKPSMRVLEIGPGDIPSTFQRLIGDSSIFWHTLDITDDPMLTYRALSEYEFPVESASYDLVLSGNVIEHVRKIWVWLPELARVCKPSGLVVTINPVSWPYHEAPIDCWRIYPEGMKALYESAGLDVEMSHCESLELPSGRHGLPGCSPEYQSRKRRFAYRLLSFTGFPVECAFDTITIGRKHNLAHSLRASTIRNWE
jgi:SAM-dependent methyltransferase